VVLRNKLADYLHELLACANFTDYAPNGIQIEGKNEIHQICTAVTASTEVIEQAATLQADALLVHHGYFWRGEDPTIVGMKRRRIKKLLKHDITLFAYHLPLDCHFELGNNACLAKIFALDTFTTHQVDKIVNLLWSGSFAKAKTTTEFLLLLQDKLRQKPLHIAGPQKLIKRIAWCSGAAQDFIDKAHTLEVDAYISGEVSERTYYQAKELGIHYFACGHHATERYGVQALGNHLATQFGLQHHFIDSDNPI
jgi:dinuclear metal center YbgI/SA1388 family protein